MQGQRWPEILAVGLTVTTGSTDAICFTHLGDVFSSVMTGNIVLLGISAGRPDSALAEHVAVAVAAFVTGVVIGSRIAGSASEGRPLWPLQVTAALMVELGAFAVLLAGWLATGGRPTDWAQVALLAVAATAMGIQSGAVRGIRLPGLVPRQDSWQGC